MRVPWQYDNGSQRDANWVKELEKDLETETIGLTIKKTARGQKLAAKKTQKWRNWEIVEDNC